MSKYVEPTIDNDWMEMKYIGNEPPKCDYLPMNNTNWVYTPSGRICANFKDTVLEESFFDEKDDWFIFTFIDFVSKVCFEITIEYKKDNVDPERDNLKVDCFYFTAEDEMVIIAAYRLVVRQLVYKVDYIKQKFELKETITRTFMERDDGLDFEFSHLQVNRFITCDRINYILLTSRHSYKYRAPEGKLGFFTIYMIPTDPEHRDIPAKEFKFAIIKQQLDFMKEIIIDHLKPERHNFGFNSLFLDADTCMLRGTKLRFNYRCCTTSYDTYQIIGNFCEVDLTKLKDVSNNNLGTINDINQLFREQEGAIHFVKQGDAYSSADECQKAFEFYHSEEGIGTLYLIKRKWEATELTCVYYPQGTTESDKKIILDLKIPIDPDSYEENNRFSLHPTGTLLHFYLKKDGSILFRVLKCLKMNLKALALSRALFHKDTLIRYHPAYRLCLNGTKPNEYFEKNKISRKRHYN